MENRPGKPEQQKPSPTRNPKPPFSLVEPAAQAHPFHLDTSLRGQVEQFPVPIASLHEVGLAVGIGLGDVLYVGADEDQAAGAAFAFADRNAGTDAGLSGFEFSFSLRSCASLSYADWRTLRRASRETFVLLSSGTWRSFI